ncbi:MAG: hypothetical protein OEW15_01020 [Nitrospirota bacterium]|nr:hypothetical protein [Nitrospirota bacterium]
MKRTVPFILMILTVLVLSAGMLSAGELKVIELYDGTVLTGEVLSLSTGVYTIRTESMGTVTVKDTSVRVIRAKGSGVSSPPADHAAQVQSLQKQMIADQEIMSMIQSLKDDPSFQKAMEDPAIMQAVTAGDIATLLANPKFLELMNNSTVKSIQQKVTK